MKLQQNITRTAAQTINLLVEDHKTIVTAESCTGGLIAGALTSIAGSSATVYGGFVTYANEAKMAMIGVPEETLATFGAVSEQTARAMAEGARRIGGTDIALAVTGIAGPGGGSPDKPVGLVYVACATVDGTVVKEERFGDKGRDEVREATVLSALKLAQERLSQE